MKYRQAENSDLNQIESLLTTFNLHPGDFSRHLENFIIAEKDGEIIGVGGFENCGATGLLRSFAVKTKHRNLGVSDKIFEIVKSKAEESGLSSFYLLTTTASEYFKRFGFKEYDRNLTPELITKTGQFSTLCPASAVLMYLNFKNDR